MLNITRPKVWSVKICTILWALSSTASIHCHATTQCSQCHPHQQKNLNTLNLILLLALSLDYMHVSKWMKQDCKNSKYQASINENSLATSITWYPNFQVLKLCLLCTYYVMKRSTDYRKPSSTNQQRQKSYYLKMGPKAHSRRQKSTSLDQSVISGHQKCMLAWPDITDTSSCCPSLISFHRLIFFCHL